MIRVSEDMIDPGEVLAAFESSATNAGAVVSFLGRVRSQAGETEVRSLFLQHYPGVTEKYIANVEAETRRRWTIDDILIIHRVGELKPGEAIVFVCVSAAHRREAFEAADFLMDYLKTEALFWKKEITQAGETWIEPREQDYMDAARWNQLSKDR